MSKEQSKALFYTQGVEEVLKSLDTSIDGLSTAQAKERLDAYGYNELDEGEKRSLLSKFIDQFKDLMIIISLHPRDPVPSGFTCPDIGFQLPKGDKSNATN